MEANCTMGNRQGDIPCRGDSCPSINDNCSTKCSVSRGACSTDCIENGSEYKIVPDSFIRKLINALFCTSTGGTQIENVPIKCCGMVDNGGCTKFYFISNTAMDINRCKEVDGFDSERGCSPFNRQEEKQSFKCKVELNYVPEQQTTTTVLPTFESTITPKPQISKEGNSKFPVDGVLGGGIGLLVIALLVLCFFFCRRKTRRARKSLSDTANGDTTNSGCEKRKDGGVQDSSVNGDICYTDLTTHYAEIDSGYETTQVRNGVMKQNNMDDRGEANQFGLTSVNVLKQPNQTARNTSTGNNDGSSRPISKYDENNYGIIDEDEDDYNVPDEPSCHHVQNEVNRYIPSDPPREVPDDNYFVLDPDQDSSSTFKQESGQLDNTNKGDRTTDSDNGQSDSMQVRNNLEISEESSPNNDNYFILSKENNGDATDIPTGSGDNYFILESSPPNPDSSYNVNEDDMKTENNDGNEDYNELNQVESTGSSNEYNRISDVIQGNNDDETNYDILQKGPTKTIVINEDDYDHCDTITNETPQKLMV